MTSSDSTTWNTNKSLATQPSRSLSSLGTAQEQYPNYTSTKHADLWSRQAGIEAGRATLPKCCWDMRLVFQGDSLLSPVYLVVYYRISRRSSVMSSPFGKGVGHVHARGGVVSLLFPWSRYMEWIFFFFLEYCANISDFIYPTHLYKRVQDEPILNEIFIHRHCKIYVRI